MHKKLKFSKAFTLVELLIVLAVVSIVASIITFGGVNIQKTSRDSARDAQVGIIANSLEKYYRENGEYPSVAAMTNTNVDTVKQKLGISNPTVFKLPLATTTNSIVTTGASPTKVVYSANTTDTTKNAQCQTDVNGYCDGYTLAYVKEAGGTTQTKQSLHSTFQAIKTECDPGDTQSGSTCTHTYTGTYQAGAYSCPSGGTLSGTTCTRTYAASYSSGSTTYYCDPPTGTTGPDDYGGYTTITISGTTCYSSYNYPAVYSSYNCPNGGSVSGSTCTMSASSSTSYSCPNGGSLRPSGSMMFCTKARNSSTTQVCQHSGDTNYNLNNCRHDRPSYNTKAGCEGAGYTWNSPNCFEIENKVNQTTYSCDSGWSQYTFDMDTTPSCVQPAQSSTTYSCPSGWTVSGSNCTQPASPAYYCQSGGTLSGSRCTTTGSFPAKSYTSSGYYYCNGSDTLSGTTCTQTYAATQGPGYYTCPQGGVASGSTCSYTYQLSS